MKQFIIVCGAIGISVVGSAMITFPIAAILGVGGYFYISELFEDETEE